jgi:hypothetical protein
MTSGTSSASEIFGVGRSSAAETGDGGGASTVLG